MITFDFRSCVNRLLAMLLLTLFVGCGTSPPQSDRHSSTVTLYFLAAASTVNVAEELAAAFEKTHGIRVKVITGPSNALAQQILNGAPADLFLAASPAWIEPLAEQQLLAETRPLLENRLVIAVPTGNPAGVTSPRDLRTDAVKNIALAGENVPAGIYAENALRALHMYEDLLAGGKIVRGHDVRVTLSYIERGEVEAGIVYASDVLHSKQADGVFTFPDDIVLPVVLPVALIKGSKHAEAAKQLYDELDSPASREIYERFGFTSLD